MIDRTHSLSTGPRILVVEDDAATAKSLAKLLSKAGYIPTVSHNGADAIANATADSPDAAVIDVHLPDLNGLVLSRKLRELIGPDAPIIVLSGDTSMETINSLPHVGATYFVSKPLNVSGFLELLGKWLPVGKK